MDSYTYRGVQYDYMILESFNLVKDGSGKVIHYTAGGYCSEVKADISKLWDQIAEAEKKHVESKNGIKGRLDALSKKWQDKLKARGKRCGGTHRAWKKGMKDPESGWYLPFSMANASATRLAVAGSRGTVAWMLESVWRSRGFS